MVANRTRASLCALMICVLAFCLPAAVRAEDAPAYKVGDKVDALNVVWNKGVVKQIGSGGYEGYLLIKHDELTNDGWYAAKNLRARKEEAAPPAPASFKVGDVAEGWNVVWNKGIVTEIGKGTYDGYIRMKLDKSSGNPWYDAKNVRAYRDPADIAKEAGKLKLAMGKYQCGVFLQGGYVMSPTSFTLKADGIYESSAGEGGKYEYDAATKKMKFIGGTLSDSYGRVEAEVEHKRLIIRLNLLKDAGESEAAQNWRAQYCSPAEKEAANTERDGRKK